MTWLEEVLAQAQDNKWCTRTTCTTCGAMDFRLAYRAAAQLRAGVPGDSKPPHYPRDIFRFPATHRQAVIGTLIEGLREMPPLADEALRTILFDLYYAAGDRDLNAALAGTPAGEALRQMIGHAAAVDAKREEKKQYESPEAVRERKGLKREAKIPVIERRMIDKRQRDSKRLEDIENLRRLSPAELLARLARDTTLNIDVLPVDLIPTEGVARMGLDDRTVAALVARIGRRRGAWGRLRKALEP